MKRVKNLLSQLDLIQSGNVIVTDTFNRYFLCMTLCTYVKCMSINFLDSLFDICLCVGVRNSLVVRMVAWMLVKSLPGQKDSLRFLPHLYLLSTKLYHECIDCTL